MYVTYSTYCTVFTFVARCVGVSKGADSTINAIPRMTVYTINAIPRTVGSYLNCAMAKKTVDTGKENS